MIHARNIFRALSADSSGSVAIEFGLVGPMFIGMLLGVIQVGIGLQAYNAMRNVSADVARHVTVQYQTGNQLTDAQIRGVTRSQAAGAPYLMKMENLEVVATTAATSRVVGAKEITLRVDYTIPIVMPFFNFDGPTLNYIRPIFVIP